MSDFSTFWRSLKRPQKERFAFAVGTTAARLGHIANGADCASPQVCVAIARESGGIVDHRTINDAWVKKGGILDSVKRTAMDWDYVEKHARANSPEPSLGKSIQAQIETVSAELSRRRTIYPTLASHGLMLQSTVEAEIKAMEMVLHTLTGLHSLVGSSE